MTILAISRDDPLKDGVLCRQQEEKTIRANKTWSWNIPWVSIVRRLMKEAIHEDHVDH
jgi:hypothetical protein